jgi:hypothetical protein
MVIGDGAFTPSISGTWKHLIYSFSYLNKIMKCKKNLLKALWQTMQATISVLGPVSIHRKEYFATV